MESKGHKIIIPSQQHSSENALLSEARFWSRCQLSDGELFLEDVFTVRMQEYQTLVYKERYKDKAWHVNVLQVAMVEPIHKYTGF